MKAKNTTKGNGKKAKEEKFDVEVYFQRANESSSRFISELVSGVTVEIPEAQATCKTQKEFSKKVFPILDRLFDAFTEAQTDAIKCATAQIAEKLGLPPMWTPREANN
jgi:hypothetical protein